MTALFINITTDKAPYAIEPPFEIPESWVWVRLDNLGEIIGGGTPKTEDHKNWENGNIPWITPADMKYIFGKYVSEGNRNITEKGLSSSSARLLSTNSIIYSSRAPIGYIAITENELCTNQGFKSIDLYIKSLANYLYYCLIQLTPEIQSRASGTTFKEISGSEFGKTIIPLPPFPEQHRIVQKIEELLPFVEQYDKTEQKLTALNKNFPEQLKKSILQSAIQGKLTERLPTDEPASELLKRIEAEKIRLIRDGKLKKPKVRDNSQNAKFEPPFEIPQGWEWVRLGDIIEINSGVTYSKIDQITQINEGTRIIRGGNIINNELQLFDNDVIIKNGKAKENQFLKIGDLITPSVTSLENIGKFALIKDVIENSAIGGFIFCLRNFISDNVFNNYLFCLLRSEFIKKQMQEKTNKSGQAFYNLGKTKFEEVLLPIPSLNEQYRIVKKVELLLSQIKRL